MKKSCLVALAALCLIPGAGCPLRAADPDSLLEKQVRMPSRDPKNYDEMVANIRKASGLKVKIDPRLATLMKALSQYWTQNTWGGPAAIPLQRYIHEETWRSGLRWSLDEPSRTITLTPVWMREDGRSADGLLNALRVACVELQKVHFSKNNVYSPAWMAARKPCGLLLNALISKKENYEKGWKTRMVSLYKPNEETFMADTPDVILVDDLTDSGGKRGVVVVVRHALTMMPGDGGFSYYYFTPGGVLVHSGLFSCGGDSGVVSVSVENGRAGSFSGLVVRVFAVGFSEKFRQKFVMEPEGLRLTEIIRANGDVMTGEKLKRIPEVQLLADDAAPAN